MSAVLPEPTGPPMPTRKGPWGAVMSGTASCTGSRAAWNSRRSERGGAELVEGRAAARRRRDLATTGSRAAIARWPSVWPSGTEPDRGRDQVGGEGLQVGRHGSASGTPWPRDGADRERVGRRRTSPASGASRPPRSGQAARLARGNASPCARVSSASSAVRRQAPGEFGELGARAVVVRGRTARARATARRRRAAAVRRSKVGEPGDEARPVATARPRRPIRARGCRLKAPTG